MPVVNSRCWNLGNVEMPRACRVLRMCGAYRVRRMCAVSRGLGAVAALGGVLALTACGFRLAGSDPLPGVLARPYLSLKDPYTDFSREFEHQLKSSGATLQVVRANSTATIDVTKDLVVQRTLSVSAQNTPTEYELTYTVTFAVQGTDKELRAPQTISLSKDYSFEENVLLAKEHEADILRQQMARDLVSIAMRRLTSLK
jgi:LPS-assembly lipoprotein